MQDFYAGLDDPAAGAKLLAASMFDADNLGRPETDAPVQVDYSSAALDEYVKAHLGGTLLCGSSTTAS